MTEQSQLDQLCIDNLRTLSIDAVQQAQSVHPGTPMGTAPTAFCLWQRFLRCDTEDPDWPDRDRFVLSSGHASMLLYSLLYLCGAAIGGLRVNSDHGWFAARPSGTEDIYKIYAESFRGADHLRRIPAEAQAIVSDTLTVEPETPADT